MNDTIKIVHPDTLYGFATAYAVWYAFCVAIAPDCARPEVEWVARPVGTNTPFVEVFGGETYHKCCIAPVATWNRLVKGFPVPDVLRYVVDHNSTLPDSEAIRYFITTLSRHPNDILQWVEFDVHAARFAGTAIARYLTVTGIRERKGCCHAV